MPGEAFFVTLGGLGVSLAGFAGLIAALDRRWQSDDPIQRWRIRNIVTGGFTVTMIGLGVIALHLATGSVQLTSRVSSLLLAGTLALRHVPAVRRGPEWPEERRRVFYATVGWVVIALSASNIVMGSAGFLAILLFLTLNEPIGIFINAVEDVTGKRAKP
jgi:hypothetical protein